MKKLLALTLSLFATVASAQVFQYYGPANGIQKNTGSTYQNTAAVSADIANLWIGTNCGVSTNVPLLNGNCATPSTGSVTSVGFSDTSTTPIYTIGSSPVTTSGTITLNLNTQSANTGFMGPTTGAAAQPTFRALVAADIPNLGANPTGTIGLTAVNGVATTYVRSDGAPALSQAISPTWSGTHTFSNAITVNGGGSSLKGGVSITAPASGNALSVTGLANSYAGLITGSSTTGQSLGLKINAGTNSSDVALNVTNQANTTNFGTVKGDGSFQWGNNGSGATLSGSPSGDVTIATPASGTALSLTAATNQPALGIQGASTGLSEGLTISAGLSSSDYAIQVLSSNSSLRYFLIAGDGHGTLGPSAALGLAWGTGGNVTIATPTSGAALTLTPSTGSPAITVGNPPSGVAAAVLSNSGQVGLALNSSGTDYGVIQNDSSNKWSLAHTTATNASALGTDVLSWTAAGNVTIANPTSGTALTVNGNPSGTNTMQITASSTTGQSFGLVIFAGTNSSDHGFQVLNQSGASSLFEVRGDGEVEIPSLAQTSAAQTGTVCWGSARGQLTVDTTVACLSSTKRVKRNIVSLNHGLDEILALRPVAYDLKPEFNPEHLGRQVGLIAEEVQKVDDRLIALDDTGQPRGVRYMQFTAVLTKAIQEQQKQIDVLRAEVADLDNRLGIAQVKRQYDESAGARTNGP